MENISKCLTAWLNGFSGLEEIDLTAYRDGGILLCVAQDVIEDIDFTSIPDDLTGVMKCIEHAYGRTFTDIDVAKASTATMDDISTDEDTDTNTSGLYYLIRISSLLLGYTVQSNKKSDHIAAILALPEDVQGTLMERIEGILQEVGGNEDRDNENELVEEDVIDAPQPKDSENNTSDENTGISSPTIDLHSSSIESYSSTAAAVTTKMVSSSTVPQFTSPNPSSSQKVLSKSLQKVTGLTSPSADMARRAVSLSMPILASLAADNAIHESNGSHTLTGDSFDVPNSSTPTKGSNTKRQRMTAFTSPSGTTPHGKQRSFDFSSSSSATESIPFNAHASNTTVSILSSEPVTFVTTATAVNNPNNGKTSRELDAENNALKEEVSDLREEIERYKRRCAMLTQAANEVQLDNQSLTSLTSGAVNNSNGTTTTTGRVSIMGGFGNPYRKTNYNNHRSTLGGGLHKNRVSLAGGDDILAFMNRNVKEEDDEDDYSSDDDDDDDDKTTKAGPVRKNATVGKLQEELTSTKASLQEAETKIKQLQTTITKQEHDTELLTKLKDEIDILRPQAAAKERAEQAVERFKKRIDALGEVKESLKKTEQLNQELTNKLFDTEKEAAKVKPLRQALEEAKEGRTTAEVRCSELEAALMDAQHTCEELRSALSMASSSSSSSSSVSSSFGMPGTSMHEFATLVTGSTVSNEEHYLHSDSTLSTVPSGGDGLQEFNPDLMTKLVRLERENNEYRELVAAGEAGVANSARVVRLETELDDLRRIKSAFESKFHQFKNKSQELETNIHELKQQITQHETTIRARDNEIMNLQSSLNDTKVQLEQTNTQINHLTATLADVRATHTADVTLWMNKYEDKSNELAREKSSFAAYIERSKLEMERINFHHNEQIQDMDRQLRESINDAAHRAESIARTHEHAVAVLRADAVAAQEAAQQKYALLEASAAARLSAVQENAATAAALATETAERTLAMAKTDYERKETAYREEYTTLLNQAQETLQQTKQKFENEKIQLQEQMRIALESAQETLHRVQTEAESKYTALQDEFTRYQTVHSISDAEGTEKITALETALAETKALVQGLENQKQQGLMYVASLQERIQQAEEEANQTAETANQELEAVHAQLEVLSATNDESSARVALLESRLLEARKEGEAMKEKATKLSRQLSNIEATGNMEGSEVSNKLKELTVNLDQLYQERDYVGKQLSAALTHIQNLGHNVPPCILEGVIPDPIGHGSATTVTSTESVAVDGENGVGTRTRRQKGGSASSSSSTVSGTAGARRVLRGSSTNTGDDETHTGNTYTNGNNGSSSTTNIAVMVAELRSQLASKEMAIVRAQTAVEEQRQLRLHAEIKAEEATDNIEVLEKRLTRATLHTQRLVKALEEAGVHVMNADTGNMVISSDGVNGGGIDLNGSLIITDEFSMNHSAGEYGNTNNGFGYPSNDEPYSNEDEFISADQVLGGGIGGGNNSMGGNTGTHPFVDQSSTMVAYPGNPFPKPNFATMASNQGITTVSNNGIRPRLSMLPNSSVNSTVGIGGGRHGVGRGMGGNTKTMTTNGAAINGRLSIAPSGTL